jgi:aspartate dehydrogenase
LLRSAPNVVVEAASPEAVTAHAEQLVSRGISLIIASGSALMDSAFRERLEEACRHSGARVYVPGGALAGLDVLYAAAGHFDHISLSIRDPEANASFRGPAPGGIAQLPHRLNLAAAAWLASGHPIELDYAYGPTRAIELTASGYFGQLHARTTPCPRTVALSLLAVLRRLQQPIIFG